jgi:hypothetical protein
VMGRLGNLSCAQLLEMMAGAVKQAALCKTVRREIVMVAIP